MTEISEDVDGFDYSRVDALDAEFARKRQEQHDAEIAQQMGSVRNESAEADARAEAEIAKGVGEKWRRFGLGALAAGVGVGAAAWGLSFLLKPQADIRWLGDQLVLNGEIVGPHLTGPAGERGERGPAGERGLQGPAGAQGPAGPAASLPAPALGEKATTERFTHSAPFQTAPYHGQIVSHRDGEIRFDTGRVFLDVKSDGSRDFSVSSTVNDGEFGYCAPNGRTLPDGLPAYRCYALHNGAVAFLDRGAPAPVPTRPPATTTRTRLPVASPTPSELPDPFGIFH